MKERQRSINELIDCDEQPISVDVNDKEQILSHIKAKIIECHHCQLRDGATQVVFGDGDADARLMLVGEAPGAEEDRQGIPFVGKAGQLLEKILLSVSIERSEVYIANIVKCRPPSNRIPLQEEVDCCFPHLKRQIEIIKPEIIVCLGALATRTLISRSAAVTKVRGVEHYINNVLYIATFHPAALLRDPGKKVFVWQDFQRIAGHYDKGGRK